MNCGETIEDIAQEKTGIIKRCRPLVLLDQGAEVLEAFKKTVAGKNSLFIYLPEAARITSLMYDKEGTRFSLNLKRDGATAESLELSIYGCGDDTESPGRFYPPCPVQADTQRSAG